MKILTFIAVTALVLSPCHADEPANAVSLIGYTELQTNLPGGRDANVRTMRAVVCNTDGSNRRLLASELADNADAWTQFAGWSPDGRQAIVARGWQDPENARWEEEHKTFRFLPDKWALDSCLVDMATGKVTNITAIERVSSYNGGLFFRPGGGFGFTALINNVSKPFVMDAEGRNKRDVSGEGAGFVYGYSASPDGRMISYHENYQIYIAKADGSDKRKVETGHPFNFHPKWSPDGEWLLFVSGEHYNCHPHIVRRDGTGLRKLADRNGYRGVTNFLDVPDFHEGSSDTPVWSALGKRVYYTAKVGENIVLFEVPLEGEPKQLTRTAEGATHYHPTPSPDGRQLLIGSNRGGVRQLFVINLADHSERQVTHVKAGFGAMWPHWQPTLSAE